MSESRGGCCQCCCSFIFTLGLTSLFMWLSLRTSNPKCSIEFFGVPSLNKTLNNPDNTTVYFRLKLQNTNKDKGVYYDDVNVTIFDSHNRTKAIGGYVVPHFYQGHKKTAKKDGSVNASKAALRQATFPNGSAVFRVDMTTAVRFKIVAWKTKRHRITVGADVEVNDEGTKVNRKNVKLSQAPITLSYCVVVGVLLNFFVFFLLNF